MKAPSPGPPTPNPGERGDPHRHPALHPAPHHSPPSTALTAQHIHLERTLHQLRPSQPAVHAQPLSRSRSSSPTLRSGTHDRLSPARPRHQDTVNTTCVRPSEYGRRKRDRIRPRASWLSRSSQVAAEPRSDRGAPVDRGDSTVRRSPRRASFPQHSQPETSCRSALRPVGTRRGLREPGAQLPALSPLNSPRLPKNRNRDVEHCKMT